MNRRLQKPHTIYEPGRRAIRVPSQTPAVALSPVLSPEENMNAIFQSVCSFCGREYARRTDKAPEGCRDPIIRSHGVCPTCNAVVNSVHDAVDLVTNSLEEDICKSDALAGIHYFEKAWRAACEKLRNKATETKGA